MKGHPEVIEVLNRTLCKELTGINQYFIHSKMLKDWGYEALAKHAYDESIEEMQHADKVIERILFLEGIPNMSKYEEIRVGATVMQQHQNDKILEEGAIANLREGVKICGAHDDHVTRLFLEQILTEEEEHLDWLETQFHLINEMGYELYLSQQMRTK